MIKNILVTGGTGFIGSHVVAELLSCHPNASIRILTRRAQTANLWGKRVEFIQGNVTNPATLPAALANIDVIAHSVQFPNHPVENPGKGWTYRQVDGKGTGNIVQVCRKAGVERFVYLSAAGVSTEKKEPWYHAKWKAEEAVRASGMEYVILRPSWVYGPEDRSLNRYVALTRHLPFVPVIGNGRNKAQPISVFDVAKIVARSVSTCAATNRVFELGGPEELSLDETLHVIQKVLGKRRPLLHQPVALVKVVAGLMSMLPGPPFSPSALDFILREERVDPRPAEEVFGLKFENLEAGLRRYLKN